MPTSWASFPPGHLGPGRGGLLSRVAACRWHGPAVGRACLSQAGPRFRVAAVWGLPASFRSHKARAACVWSAGPGRLWGQLALAMASASTPLPQAPQLSPGRGRGWAGGATQARVGQGESRAFSPPAGLCLGSDGCPLVCTHPGERTLRGASRWTLQAWASQRAGLAPVDTGRR